MINVDYAGPIRKQFIRSIVARLIAAQKRQERRAYEARRAGK